MQVQRFFATALVTTTTIFGGVLAAAVPPGRTVEITADDTMKYSVTTINAKPGEALTVKLTNKGTMPKMAMGHNFVLFKKGVDVQAFTADAVTAGQTDYIPAKYKAQIIANTKILGPGESAEVSFTAPKEPGSYTYICSFPGHSVTMKGTLVVGGSAGADDKKGASPKAAEKSEKKGK
jgi:azurin